LYLEAAYEDALALLDTRGTGTTADVHLYRALCLLALGRSIEADAAIASSIEADPLATVARQDVSPRVAAMLASARRRMLPEMARRRVADGRLLYQQGDRAGATQRFEAATALLDDPTLANESELADLKALASGFLDLIRAQSATPTVSSPAAPARATATPPPVVPPSAPLPPAVSRPTVVSQTLPPWRPPDPSWRNRELRGSVLLSIDASGRVTSATMQQRVYPGYDRLLLEAARTWRYMPAVRDGQPTPSQLVVPIVIRPSD
jgi:TonB family protein